MESFGSRYQFWGICEFWHSYHIFGIMHSLWLKRWKLSGANLSNVEEKWEVTKSSSIDAIYGIGKLKAYFFVIILVKHI